MSRTTFIPSFIAMVISIVMTTHAADSVYISLSDAASPRVQFGASKLTEALQAIGLTIAKEKTDTSRPITLVTVDEQTRRDFKFAKEGFMIRNGPGNEITISGGDDSGTLYGALELAKRVTSAKSLPQEIVVTDEPRMPLRATCIGMQKTYILPGRKVYEYPYTPELFPFFYDKAFWTEYLDFLADNRFNALALWNGQPFASLVKVQGYEYAQEVPDDVFAKNVEMYKWIAAEADKRGIWLIQMFYSIILPKPLAEKNGIDTQLKVSVPVADDYMRKAISQFVTDYPHVGLMPCMGEALQGIDNQKAWLCDVILPGVKDGMTRAGLKDEPPVLLRTHATDLRQYMADALKVYKNLYTEAKFNGESLTTYEPRGKRQQVHLAMSQLGSTHLINIHILANLEPFRYGAQRFIQKCVQAGRDRLGAKGIHLYPLAYWSWPESPDNPPLDQVKRDWIWFEAWGRYAWNPDVDAANNDRDYWVGRLTEMYGDKAAAGHILDAYNDSGECAPRILRRFGITEGNRQTMMLGMTLDELVNPTKYRAFEELWESQSPPGERLQEYVDKEWNKQAHEGETPPQIITEILDFSAKAVASVDAAEPLVKSNRDEFERLRNDVHCIRAVSQNYAAKANAAILVLRYEHSKQLSDLEQARTYLAESLDHYRELVKLTENAYRFANTMQTNQRKIPTSGGDKNNQPANYHWKQLLPMYEAELAAFDERIKSLKGSNVLAAAPAKDDSGAKTLKQSPIKIVSGGEAYAVNVGASVFSDRDAKIATIAPELVGLTGIRFSDATARAGKYVPVEFESTEPVLVLIGYVKSKDAGWLQVPDLETDALAAERGGIEPSIQNAVTVEGLPAIDVHALKFGAGRQKLEVRGNGSFIVLGVVPQSVEVPRRDAKLPADKQ